MYLSKISSKKIFVASICSGLALTTAIALPMPLLSMFTQSAEAQSRRVRYVPPSNLDAPKVSVPGITRSAGCGESRCLIGLVPDLQADTAPAPQTMLERPTFYFLVPKIDGMAYFRLFETNANMTRGKRLYRTSFSIKNQSGIIAFKLPDNAPTLKPDQSYIWEFTVGDLIETERVSGSVRRVSPSQELLAELKKTSSPLDRAALLAKSGLWFETVQTLAEVQQKAISKNTEVLTEWNGLLKSANLNRVLPYSFLKPQS
jgi:hypothetical protein